MVGDIVEMASQEEVTRLLIDWSNGDQSAYDKLMPLVYQELHRIADNYLRKERHNHTLQATALVHEAYLRMVDQQNIVWESRFHFFTIAALMMRRVLVSYARAHLAAKRGGDNIKLSLSDAHNLSVEPRQEREVEIVALNDALDKLAAKDERKSKIVELRYFAGLSLEDTAAALGLSAGTVKREWKLAKAWLFLEMEKHGQPQ